MKQCSTLMWMVIAVCLSSLSSCKKTSEGSIVGNWEVQSFKLNHSPIATTPTINYPVEFTADGKIFTRLEINSCGSDYSVDKQTLTVASFGCTEACCDSKTSLMNLINPKERCALS